MTKERYSPSRLESGHLHSVITAIFDIQPTPLTLSKFQPMPSSQYCLKLLESKWTTITNYSNPFSVLA